MLTEGLGLPCGGHVTVHSLANRKGDRVDLTLSPSHWRDFYVTSLAPMGPPY